MNYSASFSDYDYVPLRTAIENYQGIFVCSAGNDSRNNDDTPRYPANYSRYPSADMHVISVGAIDSKGDITKISNYGQNTVTLLAPGEGIWSTYPYDLNDADIPGYAIKMVPQWQRRCYGSGGIALFRVYK